MVVALTGAEALFQGGDEPADSALEAVRANGGRQAVRQTFGLLMGSSKAPPAAWPKPLREFLDASTLDCAPEDREDAEAFFRQHGPEVMLSLCCLALPSDYLNERGARQLAQTGSLLVHTRRRLASTAQMVIDVFSPGGLAPEGPGKLAVVRVRLLHAATRALGDPASALRPINQEDLLYAYTSFTWLVLKGLERLGSRPSRRQVEAYLAVWRAVAPALGLKPALVQGDAETLRDLYLALRARQASPTDDARKLIAALLEVIDELLPSREVIGDSTTAADLLRYFLGCAIADELGVPGPAGSVARYPRFAALAFQLGLKRAQMRRVTLLTLENLSAREDLSIPPALLRAWTS